MHDQRGTFLVALGANEPLGGCDLAQTLRQATGRLEALSGGAVTLSRLYRTPCFPRGAGPDYVNAAARLALSASPRDVLDLLHRVEGEFGRERTQRWGRRTLDLDLIACGDRVLPDAAVQSGWRGLPHEEQILRAPDELILPHPRLQDRAFVLVPLADIAAGWVHPCLGLSAVQMRDRLPPEALAEIVPL